MNNNEWQEQSLLDDIEDVDLLNESLQKGKAKNKVHKRKWREIELIKEQRRLRRDIAAFEHYSF
jgi:hypothetical protein